MEAVARQDAAAALVDNRLRVLVLQELPRPRQNNLIRYTLRRLGYPYPTGRQIETLIGGLLKARGDRRVLVQARKESRRAAVDGLHNSECRSAAQK